jgi:hypothetical protein
MPLQGVALQILQSCERLPISVATWMGAGKGASVASGLRLDSKSLLLLLSHLFASLLLLTQPLLLGLGCIFILQLLEVVRVRNGLLAVLGGVPIGTCGTPRLLGGFKDEVLLKRGHRLSAARAGDDPFSVLDFSEQSRQDTLTMSASNVAPMAKRYFSSQFTTDGALHVGGVNMADGGVNSQLFPILYYISRAGKNIIK